MANSLITMIQSLVAAKVQELQLAGIPIYVEGQADSQLNTNVDFIVGTHQTVISVGKPIPSEYVYLPRKTITFRKAMLPIKVMQNRDWISDGNAMDFYDVADRIMRFVAHTEMKLPQGYVIITTPERNPWKISAVKKDENVTSIELQLNVYFFAEIADVEVL